MNPRALALLALLAAGCTPAPAPVTGPAPSPAASAPAVSGPAPAVQAPYTGPLPDYATQRPDVERNYRWAATNRAILRYYPCTCGCEAQGHTSNWSCYVKEEKPGGEYVWDPMSAG